MFPSPIHSVEFLISVLFFFFEAVPSELVCGTCQEKVIEAVGKMIRVMEEEKGPGILSAVETGKSILAIIGVHLLPSSA